MQHCTAQAHTDSKEEEERKATPVVRTHSLSHYFTHCRWSAKSCCSGGSRQALKAIIMDQMDNSPLLMLLLLLSTVIADAVVVANCTMRMKLLLLPPLPNGLANGTQWSWGRWWFSSQKPTETCFASLFCVGHWSRVHFTAVDSSVLLQLLLLFFYLNCPTTAIT